MPYPPTFNLRVVNVDGSTDTQITSGDVSFVEPDVHKSGRLVVCRIRSQSDIWKCPVTGSAVENTQAMTPVTRQTGQVQTPSVSPDGSELVYLSDNGGHANLWVIGTDGTRAAKSHSSAIQPSRSAYPSGLRPGDAIVYIVNREVPQLWIIRPDGRGAHKLVERGMWAAWCEDGRWLYYAPNVDAEQSTIEKVPVTGGPPVLVRGDHNSTAPTVGRGVLYFAAYRGPGVRKHGLGDQAGLSGGRTIGVLGASRWESRAVLAAVHPSRPVGRRPMARAGTCRWRDEQPLAAVHGGWLVAAGDRLRRSADAHRPSGLVVSRWPVSVRGDLARATATS